LHIDKAGRLVGIDWHNLVKSTFVSVADEDYDEARFVREAQQLKKERGWGAPRIHKELIKRHEKNGFYQSQKTVGKWIKDVSRKSTPESPDYDHTDAPSSDAPYLYRLDLLKRNFFQSGGLSVIEAETAMELRHFFDNPNGHIVDLFPQLAIIDAYARTSTAGMTLQHLDSLLGFQPWDPSGTEFYLQGLQQGWIRLPYIPMLTESTDSDPISFIPLAYQAGAYAHLRIPAVSYFSRTENRIRIPLLNIERMTDGPIRVEGGAKPFSFEELAKFCNWRQIIADCMTGDIKPFISYVSPPEEHNNDDR